MLRRRLDAGPLRDDEFVIFANTGKERTETLDFVDECARQWGVHVHWVQRTEGGGVEVVSYATAARDGAPFEQLIRERRFLPNPVMRFCTTELKIRVMRNFMRVLGYEDEEWTNVVGLRADEPSRVARLREKHNEGRWDVAAPLFDDGVRVEDVTSYWDTSPFNLRLRSWEGNCDLCFLKSQSKRVQIMRDRPDLAQWWKDREAETGKQGTLVTFRSSGPDFATLEKRARNAPMLPIIGDIEAIDDIKDCACTD